MTKKDSVVPELCVCGQAAIFVKASPGKMYCCPVCNSRGGWRKTTEEAITSWNTEVAAIKIHNRHQR